MIPLVASLTFYAYVFLSCELLRQLSRGFLGSSGLARRCLLEFLGSLQICACIFEGSIIGQYYGQSAYFLSVAAVIWTHSHIKRPGIHSNPSSLVEEWLTSSSLGTRTFLALLTAECLAGVAGFHAARLFWRLEFSPEHGQRFRDFYCTSDLTVGVGMGMWYEGAATLFDRLFWQLVDDRLSPEVATAAGSLEVAVVTIVGVHYTGMYFNPILASAMTLGCKGASLPTHFLVYWVGPILGWMVGTQLYRRCLAPSPPITADEKKKDD